jgi:predicted TIM-barrel fold metal-dependent hydrolase
VENTCGSAAARQPSRLRLFDAHLHIVDPRFPLTPNQGFVPEPFTVASYRARTGTIHVDAPVGVAGTASGVPVEVTGGAVVSGSFQGFDDAYLRDALARLGRAFVGVAQLPAVTADGRILALHAAGVRAVRFNLRRGGGEALEHLEALAHRVHDLAGWHVELYVGGADLAGLEARLARLPQVVVDHLGLPDERCGGLDGEGFAALLRLVEGGAKVKATGFGRQASTVDVAEALRRIARVDPGALLFGTDLPSTRTPRPFTDADVALARDTLEAAFGEDAVRRALHDNAVALYRPVSTAA